MIGSGTNEPSGRLGVVAPEHALVVRPSPPAALPVTAKRAWRDIVASLPADWFTPSDLPLLQEYCLTTAIFLPEINALIEVAGVTARELRTRDALLRQSARLARELRLRHCAPVSIGSRGVASISRHPSTFDGLLALRDCDV